MRRRRRKYVGQEWAIRDMRVVSLVFVLIVLGGYHPFFVVLGVAAAVAYAIVYGVRRLRHRRVQRENAAKPYWLDDFPR